MPDSRLSDNTIPRTNPLEESFVISVERSHYSPGEVSTRSYVRFTSTLRTSGLLASLTPEDLKHLLWVLTFITPQGDCQPTLPQLAHAMHVSEHKARVRLERLCQYRWQGQPLIRRLQQPSGVEAYTPRAGSVVQRSDNQIAAVQGANNPVSAAPGPAAPAPDRDESGASNPAPLTQKEKVIAASRRKYGRPRAEVERMIAEQMGWMNTFPTSSPAPTAPPNANKNMAVGNNAAPANLPSDATAQTKPQLIQAGLSNDQAGDLLARYDIGVIQRQLEWLPYRAARSPAGLLVAAIEDDYEEPFVLRKAKMQSHLKRTKAVGP